MPFQKGQIGNPNGRPKGSKYKMSAEHRDFLRDLLRKNKRKLAIELKELEGREFVQMYVTLMQYILPKPATAEVKEVPELEEFIAMTPEERQAAVDEIRESLGDESEKG